MEKNFQRGTALIIALLAMFALLLLGTYFLSFTITSFKISKSQVQALQTYYLAEAGINEAIWRLKNDSAWSTCFITSTAYCNCENWTTSTFQDTSQLLSNSSYKISIQNSSCARGEILSVATSTLGEKISQRVVKVKVHRPLASLTEDSPIFSGSPSGEVTIHSSQLTILKGNLFSNNNINIKAGSTVNVYDNPATPTSTAQEGLILAVSNVNVSLSTVNASSTCAKGICEDKCPDYTTTTTSCPPDPVEMPAIDFDSSNPTSYKSRAINAQNQNLCSVIGKDSTNVTVTTSNKCLFTAQEFENLLWEIGVGGTLRLEYGANGSATSTYYVTGTLDLRGGRKLEINGVLVADGSVTIGETDKWKGQTGLSQVTVIDPGLGIPSGLLTKNTISFGSYSSISTTMIDGLIYAVDKMYFTSLPQVFKIKGGVIASRAYLTSLLQLLELELNNDIIREGIWGGSQPPGEATPAYSPVVTIEHWEEIY